MHSLYARLLDLVFPPRCPGCRAGGVLLCARCMERCRRLRITDPPPGRRSGSLLATVNGLYQYDAPLREAIFLFKYRRRRAMAAPLGALMLEALPVHAQTCEAIVPVPLHPSRLRERGFNQSALLADAVAAALGRTVDERLARVRETPHQVGCDSGQREANVRDAFAWQAGAAAPGVVLLIDDVLTTSATMRACARALRSSGTQVVHGLALASG